MRKLTLKQGNNYLSQLSNKDQLTYDKNGFPVAGNFTKKSSGAVLIGGGHQKKKLCTRNNRLVWYNMTKRDSKKNSKKSSRRGSRKMSKKKNSKRGSKTSSRKPSRKTSKKKQKGGGKMDNLVKLMMLNQIRNRSMSGGQNTVEDTPADILMDTDYAQKQQGGALNPSLRNNLDSYRQMLSIISTQNWQEVSTRQLEAMTEAQGIFLELYRLMETTCSNLLKTMNQEILPMARKLRQKANSLGFGEEKVRDPKYQQEYEEMRQNREKLRSFVKKFENVNVFCSSSPTHKKQHDEFKRSFDEIKRISDEITRNSVQTDFKIILSKLENFVSEDEAVNMLNDLVRIVDTYGEEQLGKPLINKFNMVRDKVQMKIARTKTDKMLPNIVVNKTVKATVVPTSSATESPQAINTTKLGLFSR